MRAAAAAATEAGDAVLESGKTGDMMNEFWYGDVGEAAVPAVGAERDVANGTENVVGVLAGIACMVMGRWERDPRQPNQSSGRQLLKQCCAVHGLQRASHGRSQEHCSREYQTSSQC